MQLTRTKLLSAVSLLSTSPTVMFCPGLFHMLSSDLIEPNSLSKTKPNLRNSGFCPNIGCSIPKKVWEILQCEKKNSRKLKKETFSFLYATILCRLFHWSNIQMLYRDNSHSYYFKERSDIAHKIFHKILISVLIKCICKFCLLYRVVWSASKRTQLLLLTCQLEPSGQSCWVLRALLPRQWHSARSSLGQGQIAEGERWCIVWARSVG